MNTNTVSVIFKESPPAVFGGKRVHADAMTDFSLPYLT